MDYKVSQLSMHQAFNILFDSLNGYLDPNIPLRVRASPIDPVVTCFYVIDPKHFPEETLMRFAQQYNSGAVNLFDRVAKHIRMETEDAKREQENLKLSRKRKKNDGNDEEDELVHEGKDGELISVKYQSFHGKNTEFWWSEQHNFEYGLVVRAMGKTSRKSRNSKANDDAQLRERKHGFSGRMFTLIHRKRVDDDTHNSKEIQNGMRRVKNVELTNQTVRNMIVPCVPSLVQFWKTRERNIWESINFLKMELPLGGNMKSESPYQLNNNMLVDFGTLNNLSSGVQILEPSQEELNAHSFGIEPRNVPQRDQSLVGAQEPGSSLKSSLSNYSRSDASITPRGGNSPMDSHGPVDAHEYLSLYNIHENQQCIFPDDDEYSPEEFGISESTYDRRFGSHEVGSIAESDGTGITNVEKVSMVGPDPSSASVNRRQKPLTRKFDKDVVIEGDLIVKKDAVFGNLHIKGNLLVEGAICGQLVTPSGAADYAEWFAYLNPVTEKIEPGMVVQLRSPEQKITLDTSQNGPHLVVSTNPSVAAGLPPTSIPGALCGFIGQVPVKVKGPVKTGDLLFPSGENDGFAVSRAQKFSYKGLEMLTDSEFDTERERCESDSNEPIGTAMVSCGEGRHTILAFVRWQHNLKHQILKENDKSLNYAMLLLWIAACVSTLDAVTSAAFFLSHQGFQSEKLMVVVELLLHLFSATQFPNYLKFVTRGDCLVLFGVKITKLSMALATTCGFLILDDDKTKLFGASYISKVLFVSMINIVGSLMALFTVMFYINAWFKAYPGTKYDNKYVSGLFNSVATVVELFPNSSTNIRKKTLATWQSKKNQ